VFGRDAALVPTVAERNCAAIAARAYLDGRGVRGALRLTVDKGLAASGGMGGSAASSVAGAWAAHLATSRESCNAACDAEPAVRERLLAAALAGESSVAGRHLDNIAASLLGGLTLARSVEPIDVVALRVTADWWLALVTPDVRIGTRQARALLPESSFRDAWVQQMANTAALVHAFAAGDGALLSRALDDRYAEPQRAALIPRFAEVKAAALAAGAFGGGISGAGPTVFAVAPDEAVARRCAAAMQAAFGTLRSVAHAGGIARQGVRRQ
jgi:homoserine kinase